MKSPNNNNKNNELNPQRLIAALYARVSTARQENEATIESQVEEIKNRIIEDGNMLSKENIFIDDGWSGSEMQRPGLDEMRDAAQSNNFQVLYVYDRGRLSRIFFHQEILIQELKEKDVEFVTIHDIDAKTLEEGLLQKVQGIFHEYERLKITERFRRGKLHKAKHEIITTRMKRIVYRFVPYLDLRILGCVDNLVRWEKQVGFRSVKTIPEVTP